MRTALVLQKSGNFREAERIYREVLRSDPFNIHACGNLGNILQEKGHFDEAVILYQRVLHRDPDHAVTHYNLGNTFKMKGAFDLALIHYQMAISLNPAFSDAYLNAGNIFRQIGQPEKAVDYYIKTVRLSPGLSGAHYSLAQAYHDQNLLYKAIEHYQKALQLDPNNANGYYNLANIFRDIGKPVEAVGCYRKALHIKPGMVEALNNLGNTLHDQCMLEEALVSYQSLLEIAPDFPDAWANMGNIYSDQGKLDAAEACYRRAIEIKPDSPGYFGNLLLIMLYNPDYDANYILAEHLKFAGHFEETIDKLKVHHTIDRTLNRSLRVGYVSPDFNKHSVASFIKPVLASHSRERIEVFCYSTVIDEDEVTQCIKGHCAHWRNISGIADKEAVELIRRDGIDILVDLAGHTAHNRLLLFARKPAPVQVSWIGYPATTGLSAVDYKIVDAFTDIPGVTEQYYTERLIRMPHCFLCYLPAENCPEVGRLPALASGHITFGAFNAIAKVSSGVVKSWSRIIKSVPNSQLIMKARSLSDKSTSMYIEEQFTAHGVKADRIKLMGWESSSIDHLNIYNRIDIALDTFPYNGTTTTCEALWMGVPVVTLAGNTHASRVGASLLSNVGLKELIANTSEEYADIAVSLARDIKRLLSMREQLRQMMSNSPLTDAKQFTADIEDCYSKLWHKWCNSARTG